MISTIISAFLTLLLTVLQIVFLPLNAILLSASVNISASDIQAYFNTVLSAAQLGLSWALDASMLTPPVIALLLIALLFKPSVLAFYKIMGLWKQFKNVKFW